MSCCEQEIKLVLDLEAKEIRLINLQLDYLSRLAGYREVIDLALAEIAAKSTEFKQMDSLLSNVKDAKTALAAALALLAGLLRVLPNLLSFSQFMAALRLVAAAEAALVAATATVAIAAAGLGIIAAGVVVALLATMAEEAYYFSLLDENRRELANLRMQLLLARFRLVECRRYCDDTRPPEPPKVEYDVLSTGNTPNGAATFVNFLRCRVIAIGSFYGITIGQFGGPVPYRAFLLVGNRYIDPISDLGDSLYQCSIVTGINASGRVAGYRYVRNAGNPNQKDDLQAFVWSLAGGRTELTVGGRIVREVYGIADNGTVAGRVDGEAGVVLIRDGEIVERLPSGFDSFLSMNGAGEITGFSLESYGVSTFRAVDGTLIPLPLLPGAEQVIAQRIGPRGQVVGYCIETSPPRERAFIWERESGSYEIPGLGGTFTRALDVNERGQVAGKASLPDARDGLFNAFLWEPDTGKTTDLNLRIRQDLGYRLLDAECLDDSGRIAGFAFRGGGNGQGYILRSLHLEWGTRVKLTRNDGAVFDDFLVAIEPAEDRVLLQAGLTVSLDAVHVKGAIKLSDVASIELQDPRDGLNLYLVAPDTGAAKVSVQTCEFLSYAGGQCQYAVRTVTGSKVQRREVSGPVRGFYAILRRNGENPPAEYVEQRFTGAGGVPKQLFAAIAYQESKGEGESWRQFAPPFAGSCRNATLISAEGGIGMMQVSNETALLLANPDWDGDDTHLPYSVIGHLFRLSSHLDYNMDAGARVLRYKLEHPPQAVRKRRPAYFNPGPSALEHWFHATGRYNGKASYARAIWAHMAAPPYEVSIEAVRPTVPRLEAPETSFPAHLDTDLDGRIDVELPRPEATRLGGVVKVTVRPRALRASILSVQAGLVRADGFTKAVPLIADVAGGWSAEVPVDAPGVDLFGEGSRVTVTCGTLLVYVDIAAGVPVDPDQVTA